MEPFATASDLAARWRALSAEEKARAEVLLDDGSALLAERLARAGVEVDPSDEVQATNLRSVCCAIVQRAMTVPEDMAGVSQFSQTAGPFTGSASYANPHADLYLTSTEQKRLGLKGMRAGMIAPKIGDAR